MKRLTALTAAAVAALTLTATAGASLPAPARTLMMHRAELSPARQLALADRTIRKARDVLGFLDANPAAGTGLSRLRVRLDHRWLLRFGRRERATALDRIRASRPAHYALWMCIHGDPAYRHAPGGEGAWGATNPNGHYNGLQMTWGWGELVGNPNDYSPMRVIWAAEHGYKASGYSRAWLIGQWGQTVGPCWGYA